MSVGNEIAVRREHGMTDEAIARELGLLCKAPDCGKPLDLDRVMKRGAETCDDRCRARAWKAERNYGRHDQVAAPPAKRANGRTRPNTSGLQVSYRKAVKVLGTALMVEAGDRGDELTGEEWEAEAEKVLAPALSSKQRERLAARS